jgi:hypothetical protein
VGKTKLQVEYDFDFTLLGISCHESDYRFGWMLNKATGMNFLKEEDLVVPIKDKQSAHSIFSCEIEENFCTYHIIANKGTSGLLIPESRNTDYFLVIKGPVQQDSLDDLLSQVRSISKVQTVFPVNVNDLKSKHNLLFE